MGLKLFCPDETQEPPRSVTMVVVCNGDHGLFDTATAEFPDVHYLAARRELSRLGWRIAAGKVLCPECAGTAGGELRSMSDE